MLDLRRDLDKHGNPPAYVDLTRASLQMRGNRATIILEFDGELPSRMPNDQTAVITGVNARSGDDQRSIYAEGRPQGWRPGSSEGRFSGDFSISGRRMSFVVPRSLVSGRDRFQWYAHSSWTRSTLLETDYAFDVAPDDQSVWFPGDVRPQR